MEKHLLDAGTGEPLESMGRSVREAKLEELEITLEGDLGDGIAATAVRELVEAWFDQIHNGGWSASNKDLLNDIEVARIACNDAFNRLTRYLKKTPFEEAP